MKVENKVMPNEEQLKGFLEEGHDEPIFMVNLLKFKDKAEYPDKRETNLTGKEAYAIYGKEVVGHLKKSRWKTNFWRRSNKINAWRGRRSMGSSCHRNVS